MDDIVVDIAFFGALIAFLVGVSVWARRKRRKSLSQIDELVASAETAKRASNAADAFRHYHRALEVALGVGPNTTEWTAKGLTKMMGRRGRDIVTGIRDLYEQSSTSYDWAEFEQVVSDFEQFSLDKTLVDRHALPKRGGKAVYVAMRSKLEEVLGGMPTPTTTPTTD
jgi:hypothetical protein